MNELVVDKGGQVRQAGTLGEARHWVADFRRQAGSNLFAFCYGVLGLDRMTDNLHRPMCDWVQTSRLTVTGRPRNRRLLLMPRDHLKTSMVRGLVIHMLIQDMAENVYFPGRRGSDTRILLANETSTNAEHQLRWIANQFITNQLIQAFWPEACWANPRKQSSKWNEKEIMLPRSTDYPEASIETIGVGGAVTGRHYDVFMKDDLISLEAANSPTVMANAIEWQKTSRALMDDSDKSWEIMIGTRWAAFDLYQYIIDNDPSVDTMIRAAIEEGQPIFPEMFSLEILEQLRDELGPLFWLLYMNDPVNPALVDFDIANVRSYTTVGADIWFDEDERDAVGLGRAEPLPLSRPALPSIRGLPLNSRNHAKIFGWEAARKQQLKNEGYDWWPS